MQLDQVVPQDRLDLVVLLELSHFNLLKMLQYFLMLL
jgi:hypothetical protein